MVQVALRTLHEVFEADRAGHIRTVSATVGTTALNPATGHDEWVPLAMVAADRETFVGFDFGEGSAVGDVDAPGWCHLEEPV